MKNNTEINWYDLKDREYFYLKDGVLKDLVKEGIKKSGSLSKLCIDLGTTHFYTSLKNNGGITLKKLKQLLDFVGKEYSYINNKIFEIRKGKKYSIREPRFPISLLNVNIGSILGHIVSDGCLSYDNSRIDLIRTAYYADNKQCLDLFISYIRDVFGDVHFNEKYTRNCTTLRIGNSIVGEVLKRAGGIVGNKTKLNEELPWIIKFGDKEMKKYYLSAVFSDEGAVGKSGRFRYIIMTRNIRIYFSNKEREILKNNIEQLMKSNMFPTGHVTRKISIGTVKKILEGIGNWKLLNKILNSKPKLLVDESKLLKEYFSINNSTHLIALHLNSNHNYSVESCLVIRRKENLIKFYSDIGFSHTKKQNKLKLALLP